MKSIYKYIIIITIIIIIILSIIINILYSKNKKLNTDLSNSVNNEKAYVQENAVLQDKNRVFLLTIEQLEYYNDSILIKLNDMKEQLNIKDKNLKHMQYLLSEATKKDTVIFRDTIFKDNSINVDTILGDKWYQLQLGLKFPNTITVNPVFISEKYIITSYRKETIKPPKKCAFLRWFQKKHKILEVEVVDKNPYIHNKQQKFIEIIK